MLGLVKKDLLMLRSNIRLWFILLFIYGCTAFQEKLSLAFLMPFMCVVAMLSTFSYDAYNKWDAYAITFPNGRKRSVWTKYLATLLLIFVTIVVVMILTLVIGYFRGLDISIGDCCSMVGSALVTTILMQAIMYPLIYKFGLEKARIGIFVGAFGYGLVLKLLSNYIDFKVCLQKLSFLNDYWWIILPIMLIGFLILSIKIALAICEKKEY